MSYVPGLRYVFCEPWVYQIEWHLPILQYMNKLSITPRVLAGDEDVIRTLHENGIIFENLTDLPQDYDIMFSLGGGYLPFSRYWLEKSMEAGKINLHGFLTTHPINYKVPCFTANQTKFLHAMCVADMKTINNVRSYNKEILYLCTGDPMWDYHASDEFRNEVSEIRSRFGERLLVVGVSGRPSENFSYYKWLIHCAESLGFKVVLQLKANGAEKFPEDFSEYVNRNINRYVLFAAASHVISFIMSSIVPECVYLGTKVGCKPLGWHSASRLWGDLSWITEPEQWYKATLPLYGKDYLDIVPLVHDERSLAEFLSSAKVLITQDEAAEMFGRPKVFSYTENVFRVIEQYFGEHNRDNVKKIFIKSEIEKDLMTDFMWESERSGSPVGHINDLRMLIQAGLNFLKLRNVPAARAFFRRAEMISGPSHFAYVQYTLAACFYMSGNISEARKYIYKSLFVEPERREYQDLKNQIEAAERMESTAVV